MATSSKYIQVSSSVLMEYVYSDQEQINVVGNPYRIPVTTAPIWKMSNLHSGQDQILNSDSSELIQDNLPIGTANVRNRSFGAILPYKGASLDINKLVFYNDYDPELTPSVNLPIVFSGIQSPVYDTVRLHLIQGFNFEDNAGLIMSLKVKKKSGGTLVLANFSYNKDDTFEIINPSPFFFGGKVYDSYVEIRVLSLYNLIYDYWLGVLTGDTVVERITDFDGVKREQMIEVFFGWVKETTRVDGQDYLEIFDVTAIDLPVRDQFETISAKIEESSGGDYIEFYATYGGFIIENYILDLNSSGYDFILLHDLILSEYVYDPASSTYSWVKTDELQITQTDNYDSPNLYRPIVKNSSAIAFKIDYIVRLYDRNTSSQVWKTASLISNSASKYGRKIRSINLGENPIQTKIYNQNVIKDIQINKISDPVLSTTKYITSLATNSNISITAETINPSPTTNGSPTTITNQDTVLQNEGTANQQGYSNGLGRMFIPDSIAFLRFTMYQKVNGQNTRMNLSGLGNLYIVFEDNLGQSLEFVEYPNQYTSKGGGEVVFRLSEKETKNVLSLQTRTFKIYLENDANERTFLYAGNFYSIAEYQDLAKNSRIVELENLVSNLNSQIISLTGATGATGATSSANQSSYFQSLTPSATQLSNFNSNLKNSPASNMTPGLTGATI